MQIIIYGGLLLLVGMVLLSIPNLTRADLFFAVTVAPEFRTTPAARRIVLMFRTVVWISTLAAILAVVIHMGMLAVLSQSAGFLLAFLIARNQALNHASAQSSTIEIDLAAPPERLPGGLVVALLPPCSLIALATWAIFNWDRLPERFPVHWSLSGPNRWVTTSPGTVFGLLVSHLFLCLLMVGMAFYLCREAVWHRLHDKFWQSVVLVNAGGNADSSDYYLGFLALIRSYADQII